MIPIIWISFPPPTLMPPTQHQPMLRPGVIRLEGMAMQRNRPVELGEWPVQWQNVYSVQWCTVTMASEDSSVSESQLQINITNTSVAPGYSSGSLVKMVTGVGV